jgi:hypothetical protein
LSGATSDPDQIQFVVEISFFHGNVIPQRAPHVRREALLDAYFLIKKAQALLRLADATDDPAIADRMRDLAAHCINQARTVER